MSAASARKRRGLSQRELAQASGLSVSLIRKIEQGEREDTRLETARKLAAALERRERHPEGTAEELVDALGGQFHPDYAPVLRGMLFAADRHRATGK